MGIYEQLGLKRIINASETYTDLGGSLMDPRTLNAMVEAAASFIDVREMILKVGQRTALLTHNEAAHVTSGASSGVVLSAIACMCASNRDLMDAIPDTSKFIKNEILVYKGEYLNMIPYWRLLRLTGAVIRQIEPSVDAICAAVNEKTAAVYLFPGKLYEKNVPSCEDTIPALKKIGATVVVDAAAQLPPVSNLWHYTYDLGADLCIFSGGKHIKGPQSTGFVVGKKDLIDSVRLNASPNPRIGRPYKTGKEELAGFITALEIFIQEGGKQLFERQLLQLETLKSLLESKGLNEVQILHHGRLGTQQPLLHLLLPGGKTSKGCNEFTRSLAQPVDVGTYSTEFNMPENLVFINAYNLKDAELPAVADAIGAYIGMANVDTDQRPPLELLKEMNDIKIAAADLLSTCIRGVGLDLPEPPDKAGKYTQSKRIGNTIYVSGCGPDIRGMQDIKGRLGELSIQEGHKAAYRCVLNALAIMKRDLGTLERVVNVVKMIVFVSSTKDFWQQPDVANGASELLMDVFGPDRGCPARSAIGVAVLPGNIPVEVEIIAEFV